MSAIASTLSPSVYWYLTRATGAVALVLLTISVCLGILGTNRFSAPRWPRFAVDTLHRDVSLLAVVLLVLHIVTTVLDGFAPITLIDGVIPFVSPYRTLWLGLGTLSFDLILALVISSLLRRRLGYRSWRAIHWLAYASWPIAVLHGLGTGTDTKQWWMLLLTVICLGAVLAAVLARINAVDQAHPGIRAGAFALAVVAPVAIGIFAVQGPLRHGWSRRAGTPANLLGPSASTGAFTTQTPTTQTRAQTTVPNPLTHQFSANVSGHVSQSISSAGAIVTLKLRLSGGVHGELRVRLGGQPLSTGGLSLTGSQVDLSVVGAPGVFQGQVINLEGDHFLARLEDGAGSVLDLDAGLQIDQASRSVTGTVQGTPA
jgi:DMSO/TMAO reductase YedYZ heme-binding membrane subunit